MKKTDVELVLLKSFDYWKSILCDEIDLGEVQELTDYIWDSIKEDQEINAEINRVYLVTRRNLHRLVTRGVNTFRDVYGNKIVLRFEDRGEPPCVLESGTIYLCKEHFTMYEQENNGSLLKGKESNSMFIKGQKTLDDFIKPTTIDKNEINNGGNGHN